MRGGAGPQDHTAAVRSGNLSPERFGEIPPRPAGATNHRQAAAVGNTWSLKRSRSTVF
jgi:hypothetical protein